MSCEIKYYNTRHVCSIVKRSYAKMLKWAAKNNIPLLSGYGPYVWTYTDICKFLIEDREMKGVINK